MSSSLLLMEPMGGSFGIFSQLVVPLGRGAQVVAIGGLDLPGSCGPSLARIEFDNWIFYHVVFSLKSLEFATWPLNADVEEALMLKPGCVIQRFLLSIFLSPGGELLVVVRLPTVSFDGFDAIQNYLPPLYQMNGFGKLLKDGHTISTTKVLDSVVIPAKDIRTGCPDAPSDGFVSHAWSSPPYGRLSETVVGDAAVRDRGREIRVMTIRLIMCAMCHCEMRATCLGGGVPTDGFSVETLRDARARQQQQPVDGALRNGHRIRLMFASG
ncbi:hypothetical protein CK203_061069 [Vitis vinifera]|uniref:Uncharacterized protein n=1 Tax=Vitis vinifera TaxID=29760 RepID=A0A438GLI0_VITVI|nr:hypothetical protein CK203_061069 [Vitis vinifera]